MTTSPRDHLFSVWLPKSEGIFQEAERRHPVFHRTHVKHVPMTKPVAGKTTRTSMIGCSGGSDSKESASNAGDLGSIPGLGRFLEEEMATYSSILAWENPWTEKLGGL